MPKRSSSGFPKDVNQNAARIVALTTGQPAPEGLTQKQLRSQAASILGKLGGSKGGKARAENLSEQRRSEIAKKAAEARWSKK